MIAFARLIGGHRCRIRRARVGQDQIMALSPAPNDDGVLRSMRAEDAEIVAALCRQLGYERTAGQIRAWLAEANSAQDRAAFVASVGDHVAGWIEVSICHPLQSDAYALIGGLVVDEHFRGRKIGQQLCRQAEGWAREHGVPTMRVTSRSTRSGAHRFYLRDDYAAVKTSVVFEKKLDRRERCPHRLR